MINLYQLRRRLRLFGVYLYVMLGIGISLVGSVFGQSNEGTEFWMGFMEKFELGEEERVLMITSRFQTTGLVEIPLQNWETTFTVSPGEVAFVNVPENAVPKGSETISQTGIHIQSEAPVVIYAHQYETNRAEATSILPLSSLGTSYYTMCYEGYSRPDPVNGGIENYPSEFLIVATSANTEVMIRVEDQTKQGLQAGDTQTVILSAGETYQVQSVGGEDRDLTGSFIRSDKPIAVFSGNFWTQIPNGCNARDNLYEQVSSVDTWGRQFLLIPQQKVDFAIFRVLAAEDNTQITLAGSVNNTLALDAGVFQEFTQDSPVYIESNKPIQVAQFSVGRDCNGHPNGWGDPSMVMINSLEQNRDTITFYASPFQNIFENYVNIVVREEDAETVQLNGVALTNQVVFRPAPGDEPYAYATVALDAGTHTLTADGCGLNATLYGFGDAESYAYAAGASSRSINPVGLRDITGGCVNDTLLFDSGLSPDSFTFFWDFGDGTTSTLPTPVHVYSAPGVYVVTLTVKNICLDTEETFIQPLLLNDKPLLNTSNDTTICEGDSLSLQATEILDAQYAWIGPDGFQANTRQIRLIEMDSALSGKYEVSATLNSCTSEPSIVNIEVIPILAPNLGENRVVCPGDTILLNPGEFQTYLWQDESILPFYEVLQAGTYWVETFQDNGCSASDTIQIDEACPAVIYVPTAFSPNGDGINEAFEISGNNLVDFTLVIYDRWGRIMFESEEIANAWPGNMADGAPAPEGIYVWQIAYKGISDRGNVFAAQRSGTVTLIR